MSTQDRIKKLTRETKENRAQEQFNRYLSSFANCVANTKPIFPSLANFEIPSKKITDFSFRWELTGFYQQKNVRGNQPTQQNEEIWIRIEDMDPKAHDLDQAVFVKPPPGPRLELQGKKFFIALDVRTDNLELRESVLRCHNTAIKAELGG